MPPTIDFDPRGSRAAIFGYGRFGAALTELLNAAGVEPRVVDPRADVPEKWAASSAAAALADTTWVILATPVALLAEMLTGLRPHLTARHIVFDVGSVKLHPCADMRRILGTDIAHVGTHPLFGPISLARGDRPRRVVICPASDHAVAAKRVAALFRALDCEVVEMAAADHDRAMARTHALAFFIAKGLLDIGVDDALPLAPPSFQGVQRMLAAVRGDAGHLFATIQRENPFAAEARAALVEELARIHGELAAATDDDCLAIPPPTAAT